MPHEPRDHNERRYRRFFGGDPQRDVDDELAFHLAMRIEEMRRDGLSIQDAEEAVMKRFGNVDEVRSEVGTLAQRRHSRRRRADWVDSVRRDIAFAVRTLRNSPAFAITALLTMALGIGASTAIFSVVDAVLLRPLPYRQPERLAFIWTDIRARNVIDGALPNGDMPDLIAQVPAFEQIAGISNTRQTLIAEDGRPDFIPVALVTTNFFKTLGTRIGIGRDFTDDDGRAMAPSTTPGDTSVAVRMMILSYDFWQQRFGGSSAILGKTVTMSNVRTQIVGVTPPGFRVIMPTNTSLGGEPAVYQAPRVNYATASRLNAMFRPFGRLRQGATVETAQHQLDRLSADLRDRFPIKKGGDIHMRAEPMQADLVKGVRPAILSLMASVVFVLLIACANVANLLLVRASARERELAVRAALGGTRGNLMAQMLVECLVLALGGALLGVALAAIGVRVLPMIAPADLPRLGDVSVDLRVLLFATLAAVASALVFGLVPAARASRPNLLSVLRGGGRTPGLAGGTKLRQAVVAVEVALSFALLVGAGLMVRSFVVLANVDPGFDPRGAVTFTAFNAAIRGHDEGVAFSNALAARLSAIPGVVGVTAGMPLPLDGLNADFRWGPMAAAEDNSRYQQATGYFMRPGFFQVLGTRMLAGHDFTPGDNVLAGRSIIVDDLLVAKAFPGQRPDQVIGQSILSRVGNDVQPFQIIGVVAHQRHSSLTGDDREGLYLGDATTVNAAGASRWVVKTAGDVDALARAIPQAVHEVGPRVPVSDLKPMTSFIDRAMAPTRFALVLIGIFGVIALVLAAIGLYGVVSTTARQRTAEIGVRMAFGATYTSIFRLIVGHGLLVSFVGMSGGVLAALALTAAMSRSGMLVSVRATDPLTYIAIALLFGLVAAFACWHPARRAARLDPMAALRDASS